MNSKEQTIDSGRRSTRIRAQISLRVTSLGATNPFSEAGHTLVVNPQGCGVRLARPLKPGTEIFLDELPTGTRATARVANCVPLGTGSKCWWWASRSMHPATSGASVRLPKIGDQKRPSPHPQRQLLSRATSGLIVNSPAAESFIPVEGKAGADSASPSRFNGWTGHSLRLRSGQACRRP